MCSPSINTILTVFYTNIIEISKGHYYNIYSFGDKNYSGGRYAAWKTVILTVL